MKTFPIKLTDEQHAMLHRRAKAADMSLHRYILTILTNGKINKKKP